MYRLSHPFLGVVSLVGLTAAAVGCGADETKPVHDASTGTVVGLQPDAGGLGNTVDASSTPMGQPNTPDITIHPDGGGVTIPSNSPLCGNTGDLPYQVAGCPCELGETQACWTGPGVNRYLRDCKDGTQTCQPAGEFGTWGPCEGQVLDCGEPPPDPEVCQCIPGTVIGCDEDCEAFVLCMPFASKECQPDGTWGPCRETLLPNEDSKALGIDCFNLFHGCFAENPDGNYTGDCSNAFTCGHPPNEPGPVN